jgi:hypothetical protein
VTAPDLLIAALSTLAILVPIARRWVGAAVPVTMTSLSVIALAVIAKSAVAAAPEATSISRLPSA